MNFWDSSALLPLLVEEPTSERILALYQEQPEIVAAWTATVECVSALARLERELLIEALKMCRGNAAAAARRLGVSERRMGLALHRFGIDWRRFRTSV